MEPALSVDQSQALCTYGANFVIMDWLGVMA